MVDNVMDIVFMGIELIGISILIVLMYNVNLMGNEALSSIEQREMSREIIKDIREWYPYDDKTVYYSDILSLINSHYGEPSLTITVDGKTVGSSDLPLSDVTTNITNDFYYRSSIIKDVTGVVTNVNVTKENPIP